MIISLVRFTPSAPQRLALSRGRPDPARHRRHRAGAEARRKGDPDAPWRHRLYFTGRGERRCSWCCRVGCEPAGMALYTVIFMGSQTTGALLWGFLADAAGLRAAVLGSAAVVLAGVGAGLLWRVSETGHLDPQPAVYWTDPQLAFEPELNTGPVLVAVHFTLAPERQAGFLEAMDQLRRSRLRMGAAVGSCIEMANDRTNSWKPSVSRPGRNISASTRVA
jgi:hypothetical protein